MWVPVLVAPATVTVTFRGVGPVTLGTVTVRLVGVAAVTVAGVLPTRTVLLAGVALKPAPLMVKELPIGPETGKRLVMVGMASKLLVPVLV